MGDGMEDCIKDVHYSHGRNTPVTGRTCLHPIMIERNLFLISFFFFFFFFLVPLIRRKKKTSLGGNQYTQGSSE